MITFDDVRRTDRPTFTFFPDGLTDEVKHFMALAGITKQQYERVRIAPFSAPIAVDKFLLRLYCWRCAFVCHQAVHRGPEVCVRC